MLTQLPTVQRRAYIQSTLDFNRDFYIRLPPEQISRLSILSDCIVKVIKPLHNVPEANINHAAAYHPHYKEKSKISEFTYNLFLLRPPPKLVSLPNVSSKCVVKFVTCHPHYKDKFVGNSTRTFVCAANCLYFLCGWSNLSAAFFLAHDGGACTTEPGLVIEKGEPLRTFLHLLSRLLLLPSLLFSLTLSKMRPAISEYLAMSKCATMSEWQLSHSALASFSSLADYSSIKLTSEKAVKSAKIMTKDRKYLTSTQNLSEASFDFSRSAQKVKFTADIDIISYVICLADTTNKGNIMHWYNRVTRGVLAVELYAMTHRFDIEKRY